MNLNCAVMTLNFLIGKALQLNLTSFYFSTNFFLISGIYERLS